MEIKITTRQIIKILYVLAWIIFIGACIEAGGFIFNTVFTLTYNPIAAHKFWYKVDLSSLYQYDRGYFFVETLLMCIVAVMKALMFYLIIKVLYDKKVNIARPFNQQVRRFILNLCYLALGTALFSHWGVNYAEWFVEQGVKMPDVQYLNLDGASVWLFMSALLFVIAQLFKKAIEIQSENELTV